MPGRALACARLLDQQVVVVQAHRGALHQALRQCGQGRVEDEAHVLHNVLPIAKVFKKAARVIRPTGHHAAWAGVGQVGLNAVPQQGHFFGREQVADAHRAITLVVGHVLVGGAGLHALAQGFELI